MDARLLLAEAAEYSVDLRDVRVQQATKRALEVGCAGGHNILFIAGCRQDHGGQAHSHDIATDVPRRSD